MNSIFYKRVRYSFFIFLFLIIVLFLGVLLIIKPMKFLINDTNVVYGTKIKYYNSIYNMHIYYNYTINGKTINGKTMAFYKKDFNKDIYKVRYLSNNPNVSIVDDIILRQIILLILPIIPFLLLIVLFILAFIGKLPKKYQNVYDNGFL